MVYGPLRAQTKENAVHCLQTAIKTSDFIVALNTDCRAMLLRPEEITDKVLQKIYGTKFERKGFEAHVIDSNWVTH